MSFDPLIANAGRLRILTALAVDERQEFVHLRRSTQLTDGNLASHAKRLQAGGMIQIDKQFRDGKPVTHLTLTPEGRRALEAHARRLVAAISHRKLVMPSAAARSVEPIAAAPVTVPSVSAPQADAEDEWVD
jgi:DNA-binding MarR family transcriptional regulator